MSAKDQDRGAGRRRGRPPGPGGPKAGPANHPAADHPPAIHGAGPPAGAPDDDATRDATRDATADGADVSPGDVPDDRRIRKNGTPVPLVVQKLAAIVEHKAIRKIHLESPEGADIGENRLYHWRYKAGEPSRQATIRLANYLDIPLEYLMDDSLPVITPPPRRWEAGTHGVLEAARSLGLEVEDVERYLMVVKLAIAFDVDPERAMKMIATGSVERRDYLEGGTGHPGGPIPIPRRVTPGPAARLDGPTEGEKAAERDAAQRRNGGPKPRTG